MKYIFISAILAVFLATSPTARAHHSHGNYAMTEYTHLTGKVLELRWMNPHTWIYIEVENDNGEKSIWSIEAARPATLIDRGIARDTIKAGDVVSVRCHQLRDKSAGCLLGFLTPPGGEEKEWD